MPCDYSKYPKNWKTEIVPRIRKRASDRCEKCRVRNHAMVMRLDNGSAVEVDEAFSKIFTRAHVIRIICTVAHLDHNIENNADENLAFWCQKCHNTHDGAHRARNRRETVRQKREKLCKKVCVNCGNPGPLRRGHCQACNMYLKRTGKERIIKCKSQ